MTKAYLNSWNIFEIIFDEKIEIEKLNLKLKEDGKDFPINFIKDENPKFIFKCEKTITLGKEYILESPLFDSFHLSLIKAVDFLDFDMRFAYFSNDLGANYHRDYTEFVLWAPLSYKVELKLYYPNEDIILKMEREEYGVFRIKVRGDLDGILYNYIVYNDDEVNITLDPYGKSSNANGEKSAVINMANLAMNTNSEYLPPFKENVESVIYETSVRDFTIHKSTSIKNKGKFLGFVEENRKTKGGNPAGIDYLKYLGVSHVQLLPVLDFKTVDENKANKEMSKSNYNWGYDPQQFFALEGSYSSNPNDPYARMIEFKNLVAKLHKEGIRVNLDVVYNHVYDVNTSTLQKIVPYYYFRHDINYNFIEHSFCGDDIASERLMAKKLIVDSVTFLLKNYDVDGFRFDLMGLIDVLTMNEIDRITRSIKPNIMLYGEGWDMFAVTSTGVECAHMNNADKIKNIGFFNDRYRNIARGIGGGTPLEENGYLLSNEAFFDGFKFVFLGSTLDVTFPKIFHSLNQSINYVECHDNATLFDAIDFSTKDSEEEIKLRIKMINKTILFSFGVPFIHAGQEIGMTKFGDANTYNKGDKYNAFNYDLLDANFDLATSLKNYILLRKKLPFYKISDPRIIKNIVSFSRKDNSLFIELNGEKLNFDNILIIINPTKKTIYHAFKDEKARQLISGISDNDNKIITANAMIFPLTNRIYLLSKEEK